MIQKLLVTYIGIFLDLDCAQERYTGIVTPKIDVKMMLPSGVIMKRS